MTVHFESIQKSDGYEFHVAGVGERQRSNVYRSLGKRAFDVSVILLASPIVLLLVLAIALAILASGNRPFYRQDRIGRSGRVFQIWKFRTMVADADSRLAGYLEAHPEARAEWDVHQKLKVDPRVTPLGRILRKTSIDELPQLWNVLTGEMSLVGPRPMLPEQQALYPSHDYYRLRPGITGLWQVSERNASEFRARAIFDTAYERELSFASDVRILFQTVSVVLRGTGC